VFGAYVQLKEEEIVVFVPKRLQYECKKILMGRKCKKELDSIDQCAWQGTNCQVSQEKSEQIGFKENSGGTKLRFGAVYRELTSNMHAE